MALSLLHIGAIARGMVEDDIKAGDPATIYRVALMPGIPDDFIVIQSSSPATVLNVRRSKDGVVWWCQVRNEALAVDRPENFRRRRLDGLFMPIGAAHRMLKVGVHELIYPRPDDALATFLTEIGAVVVERAEGSSVSPEINAQSTSASTASGSGL